MSILDPNGVRERFRRGLYFEPTIAEGAQTVTVTIPGAGIPSLNYFISCIASWQNNGAYLVSQGATSVVIGFSTPAPAGARLLVKLEEI